MDALEDIEPDELAMRLQRVVREASMLPGVVTVTAAERLGDGAADQAAVERAVGVQLCYEGLRLTRELIRGAGSYPGDDPTRSYLELVGAEVLVSRGFANLTATGVAPQTIEIVQRFSRNQTLDHAAPAAAENGRTLEFDVIALAVDAGAELAYDTVPATIGDIGRELAMEFDREPLPPADHVAATINQELAAAPGPAEDPVTAND